MRPLTANYTEMQTSQTVIVVAAAVEVVVEVAAVVVRSKLRATCDFPLFRVALR
jgi:hypothetical protein